MYTNCSQFTLTDYQDSVIDNLINNIKERANIFYSFSKLLIYFMSARSDLNLASHTLELQLGSKVDS